MKTIIIYYSDSGTTRIVANTLSRKLKTDIIEIKDKKERKGFKNTLTSSFDAYREIKTDIEPLRVNLEEYDTVYFGTPTWAGHPTPAIITIIDRCDLRGKDVILFATMSKSGGESTIRRMDEKITARGGRVIESFTLKTKNKTELKIESDSEIIAELLDLNLYS